MDFPPARLPGVFSVGSLRSMEIKRFSNWVCHGSILLVGHAYGAYRVHDRA